MKRALFDLQAAFADLFVALEGPAEGMFRENVLPGGTLSLQGSLEVYRRGYYARLTEALGATFEAVWWVLGDEFFFEASRDYVASHPSRFYSLSDYGAEFSRFLGESVYCDDLPFLSELAEFEWQFKELFHTGDHTALSRHDLTGMAHMRDGVLVLTNAHRLIRTHAAVYDIWKLRHSDQGDCTLPEWRHAQHLLLYKKDHDVVIKELDEPEFATLEGIEQGQRLGEVLEWVASRYPRFDQAAVSSFFGMLITNGLVRGFRPAPQY